jgi:pyruvate/2-oxoglutarate dehydrogenase complex dihydrolipoamide acyltransferase (E2) component
MSNEPITLVEWKVKEGDKVEKGNVVLIVETEKIQHDVEAEAAGFIHILHEAGKEVPIGDAAGQIAADEAELASLQGGGEAKATAAPSAEAPAAAPAPAPTAASGDLSGTKIIVPKIGMGTEPIMLVEWKAKEGDKVEAGSVVLVVETEKIQQDVTAEASGFLHIIHEAGKEVPIGNPAGVIVTSEAELATAKEGGAPAAAPAPAATPAAAESTQISPVARKMAEENMIDISQVTGSGPNGRITKEDIEKEIAKTKGSAAEASYQGRKVKEVLPLTGLRKAIANHMHKSLSISAQLTVMGEFDMTKVVKLRKDLVAKEEKLGTRITYTDLMVKAAAKLLQEFPLINASLIDDEIKVWDDINVAIAVAVDDGLIVPVVKNADQKSLVEISKTVKTIAKKARSRELAPEEVQGGTFTITNLGAMGGGYRFETIIINQPESAILGTGGITDRAVVRDGKVVVRPIMTYYMTYDHRVLTGAVIAAFIKALDDMLQKPEVLVD